mmetsp:Transcript_15790/g.44369  ORF Transcript_15790/g.44369 Transcript_15790/m.44369 type:complete len:282 (+) Transcript_15790:1484-2329(+)
MCLFAGLLRSSSLMAHRRILLLRRASSQSMPPHVRGTCRLPVFLLGPVLMLTPRWVVNTTRCLGHERTASPHLQCPRQARCHILSSHHFPRRRAWSLTRRPWRMAEQEYRHLPHWLRARGASVWVSQRPPVRAPQFEPVIMRVVARAPRWSGGEQSAGASLLRGAQRWKRRERLSMTRRRPPVLPPFPTCRHCSMRTGALRRPARSWLPWKLLTSSCPTPRRTRLPPPRLQPRYWKRRQHLRASPRRLAYRPQARRTTLLRCMGRRPRRQGRFAAIKRRRR